MELYELWSYVGNTTINLVITLLYYTTPSYTWLSQTQECDIFA